VTRQRSGKHLTRPSTDEQTIAKRLTREATSATVSYEHERGLYATVIGYGASVAERIADADSQLPGEGWTRVVVSTPSTIYSDLIGRTQVTTDRLGERAQHSVISNTRYEGKRVEL
jgi:hypothetical protein